MGQASSSPQRELTGEDLLFHVLDNDAVVRHLISTNSYNHFHSDVSKLREGSRTATEGSAAQDYFNDLYDGDKNYEVGTKKWWRAYAAAKLSGSSASERANRLGQLARDLQEQSGSAKLMKDIVMERRMAILQEEFQKIESKTEHAQESKFNRLHDLVARTPATASGPSLPVGVRVSLTTAIKIVVALLQHTTTSNPALCVTILDIFSDALKQLTPLSLNEAYISRQASEEGSGAQLLAGPGVLTEGLNIVGQFLDSTVNAFAGSSDPLAQSISIKSLETIVQLAVASGSLAGCLTAVNLLLDMQREGKGSSVLAVTKSLAKLPAIRLTLAEMYVEMVSGRVVHQSAPLWPEADEWLEDKENAAGLKADQVLVVLLKHLSDLAWFMVESVSHKKSHSLPLLLQFPFVLDLSRRTFDLLHRLMLASKTHLNQKGVPGERDAFYRGLQLTCLRLIVLNLRELNLGRVEPDDVGLANVETPESVVNSLSVLLKGFILDETTHLTDEEQQQGALIQALSSEALAVGLDYFVPSRKGQFEIFIDVLKQTTSDEVKTSSQFLLDQLLEYFSGVDTLYRLLQSEEEGAEKTSSGKQDVLSDLLTCIFTYSKRQAHKAIANATKQASDADDSSNQQESTTKAHVRFLLTLQNCIFCSAINAHRKGETAEGNQGGLLPESMLSAYAVQALAHCEDLLAYVSTLVPGLTQQADAVGGSTTPPVIDKFVGLLLNDSALALLPVLTSSLLWLLNSKSGASDTVGENVELMQQLLAFLQRCSDLQKQLGIEESESALNITQKKFTVFTTQHQYSNDMDVNKELIVPDADYTELYFDPQTKTEETHDYLRVYLEPNLNNQLGDQYSGAFHRWPQTPVVIPGGCVWLYFHSDGSNVDWGVRILAVSYYRPRKWITELQRTIVLLITKMATSRLDELHEHETAWGKWLKSPLFNGGLQQPAVDGGSELPANKESQFLRDFIALTPGPGAELHRKMNRAHLSASALQLSSISSQSVDQALRGVIAALLQHCHLVGDAMAFAASNQSTPSDELKRAYRYGYKVKKWFIQQRQKQAAASLAATVDGELKKSEDGSQEGGVKDLYRPLAEGVLTKAHALLKFRPASSSGKDATVLAPAAAPESLSLRRSMDRLLIEAGLPALVDDDEPEVHRGMAGETKVYGWESTAKAVINFIEAQDIQAASLEEVVAMRKRRAEQRVKVLASLDLILSGCAQATAALPDLLSYVALALAGFASGNAGDNKKGKRNLAATSALSLHYTHDLAACGRELEQKVSSVVYQVYRKLLSIGEENRKSAHVIIALLYALAIRFETEEDFEFLASLHIFKWLFLFMAGDKKPAKEDNEKGKEKENDTEASGLDEADTGAKEKTAERDDSLVANDTAQPMPQPEEVQLTAPVATQAAEEEIIDDEEMARRLQAQFDAELDNGQADASGTTPDSGLARRDSRELLAIDESAPQTTAASATTSSTSALEAVQVEEDDEEGVDFSFGGLFGSSDSSLRASRNATPAARSFVEVGPDIHTELILGSSSPATTGSEAAEREADRDFVKSLFPDEFSRAKVDSPSSSTSSERQKLLDKQSDCAWSLFQFLALQAITSINRSGEEKAQEEDTDTTNATNLYEAQELLVGEFIELLYDRLARANEYEGGLGAADIIIFLHSVSSVPVVLRYLAEDRWLSLLLRFGRITDASENDDDDANNGDCGKVTFTQMMAIELLSALLPTVNPDGPQGAHARQVVTALLASVGQRLTGGYVRQRLVPSFQLISSPTGAELTHRREVIGRAMLTALTCLLSGNQPHAAAWARVLSPLTLAALREHLPTSLELLQSPFRDSPSLDLVMAHLSLLGGYQTRPLPGMSVEVHTNSQRRGWVVGLRHTKDGKLMVVATDGRSESALNPSEVVVQPAEEVALSNEMVKAIGPELLQLLPLLANAVPEETLVNALVFHHLRAVFLKALSRYLVTDPALRHGLLADHPDAVKALLALAVHDNSDCKSQQARSERERLLGGAYLRAADVLHGVRLPDQSSVAKEFAEWLGKPEDKCATALGNASNDRLRAFTALTAATGEEDHDRSLKKLRGDSTQFTVSTADMPNEEFGGILSDVMWTAHSYAELGSSNSAVGFSDSGDNQPAWFQLLTTTTSLSHLYALESVLGLLSQALAAPETTLEQQQFLALFSDVNNLTLLCKALISHYEPVGASTRRLVKALVDRLHGPDSSQKPASERSRGKGKEKADADPVESEDLEVSSPTSSGLAALVQEGLVCLERATQVAGKFAVLKLESTHPYPNTSNYQNEIHLKSVSSMVILFDPQCKTENNYDWVRFRWPSQELIREFCGNSENFKHFKIDGNHAMLHFYSDDSNNFWGYRLWAVGLLNNYPSATLKTDHALRMLEFALDMWDNSATMRRAVSPLHNSRTVSLLLRALKNAVDAAAKNHAIELLQRLVAHPSMHSQTDVVEQVLDEIEVPMTRLYAVQKDDPVFSQSLQRFVELSVRLYRHLDDSLYNDLKWVRVSLEDGSLSAPEGLLSKSPTTGKPAWKRSYSLDGVLHGACFDGESDVALFEEGREIELSPKGWSVSLWFTTPLPQAQRNTTFFTLSNGDKIAASRLMDEECNWSVGVYEKQSDYFHPSDVSIEYPSNNSDVKTPTTEIVWHYLTVSADYDKAKLNLIMWSSSRARLATHSLDYVPPVGVSLKALGNSVEGGEYCGTLDNVVIRPFTSMQVDDLLPHLQLGLLKANRMGPYAPIVLTHQHCRNGEVDLRESADHPNFVHVTKGTVSVTLPVSMKAGKWYYEVTLHSNSTNGSRFGWGLLGDAKEITGAGEESWGFDPCTYDKWHNNEQTSYGKQWKEADVLGVQLDLDSTVPVIAYHLNGEHFGPAFNSREGVYRPSITLEATTKVSFNFGAQPFLYSPEGYQPVDVSAKISAEEIRVGRAKPPFVIRSVMEQVSMVSCFLTRQPLPLLFLGDAMANKEFLLFDPKLGETDLKDLFFYYLQRSNNDGADWSMERDEQLVQVINRICASKDDDPMEVAPESITLSDTISLQFPDIAAIPHTALLARFYVIRRLNLLFKSLGNVVDCSRMTANPIPVGKGMALTPAQLSGRGLASLVWHTRRLVFFNVKRELLRSICKQTECGRDPHVFRFNRLKAIKNAKNKSNQGLHTLFGQLHTQLDAMTELSVLRQAERGWKVDFQGEGATDQGGPYRESVTQISLELHGDALPLLIPSPNKRLDVGDTREKFVLNPQATLPLHLRLYRTMGIVMGICIRTRGAIDLRLPSLFWKFFVGEEATLGDLEIFDCVSAQFIRNIETQLTTPELFEAVYDDLTFTTTLSDGHKVELKEGGAREIVTFETRLEYTRLILETRLSECTKQMQAVREGLCEIVPVETIKYFTWQEMESLVVGRIDFDIEWLQKRTRYYGSVSAAHPTVTMLWEVLSSVGPEERAKFLRFVYGQSRLAPSYAGTNLEFTIESLERSGNPDDFLPEAMTCGFKLKLPLYTNKQSLTTKLMYAIHNTAEIDSDYVPTTQWDPQDMVDSDGEDEPELAESVGSS